MISSIGMQLKLVFVSLICGISLGLLFDIYRVIRREKNPNKYITFIQDILFWILAALVVFIITMLLNDAYINLYGYLFICVGIIIYIKLFSNILLKGYISILNTFTHLIRRIGKMVMYPLQLLIYNLNKKNTIKINNKKLEKK